MNGMDCPRWSHCLDPEHCQHGGQCQDVVAMDEDVVQVWADDQLINEVVIRVPVPEDDTDRELRELLGGWRDAVVSRALPPANVDPGRVAYLLRSMRWRRRALVLQRCGYALLVVSVLVLMLMATLGVWP